MHMNADTNPRPLPVFETLKLSLQAGMARIELDRPRKANAINAAMWRELREAMEWLDATPQARVGILSAAGAHLLQRLPRLVGEGMARELTYTARRFSGAEAERMRLVNRCHATRAELAAAVADIAAQLAAKSPLCLRGTKEMISYVRDRPVADGLNYIATWNAAMLYSEDVDEALRAARERRAPTFRD